MFETSYISMDIGSQSIKLVIGKKKKDLLYIKKAVTIPMPYDAYNDGRITDNRSIVKEIANALKKNKINNRKAIVTLNSSSVITREIILPLIKPEEMDNMVHYEIEQYLPIELSQYVIEHKVLDELMDGETKKARVLVAAMQKSLVESYLAMLNQLNLQPVSMDINSNALTKLLEGQLIINQLPVDLSKTMAVIDIGSSTININILSGSKLKFNRLISRGGSEIDMNIASNFNLNPTDAEKRKLENQNIDLGSFSGNNGMLYDAIKHIVDQWLQEIERVFQYYESRNSGNRVDMIYLYGGGANLKGLDRYLKEYLQVPTVNLETLCNVKLDGSLNGLDIKYYLNAIGAIIRESR